jgi:hypothetical protein
MPYYITDSNSECTNWAVEKEDGELIACHDTKESAINQAVAISIEEDTEFLGERAAIGSLAIDDYVSWSPLDPRVAAQIVMVEGQFAVVRLFDYEDGIFEPTDKMMVINVFQLEKIPTPKMIAFEVEEIDQPDDMPDDMMLEDRAINQEAPAYMRAAARRGLEYYEEGLAGDGVTAQTVREARDMAEGQVSDDKWVRIAAWIARHLVDLDSPNANPD